MMADFVISEGVSIGKKCNVFGALFPITKQSVLNGILIFFLLYLIFIPSQIAANQEDEPKKIIENNNELDTTESEKQQRWAAFPIISSSPETGFMLGGMLFHFFPVDDHDEQASSIDLQAFGTTEGQYALSFSPNIFFGDGLYLINATAQWSFWEANFYNIGNESPDISEEYESKSVSGGLALQRRFFESITLDFVGIFEDVNIEIEAGGMLDTGNILGSEDGKYVGIGLAFGYDTRDNTNSPRKGTLARYTYIRYNSDYGSDLDFSDQTWDLRHYRKISVVKDSILALAAKMRDTQGDVPFQQLSSPDGTMILRGIEKGRYRDKDMLAFQSEYRFPIKGRFSATIFTEIAQVADKLSEIDIDSFKTSFGGGIRYALNPKQRLNIRGDIAWVDGGIGVIVNVREAF